MKLYIVLIDINLLYALMLSVINYVRLNNKKNDNDCTDVFIDSPVIKKIIHKKTLPWIFMMHNKNFWGNRQLNNFTFPDKKGFNKIH